MNTPYQDPALSNMYEMLFCDNLYAYQQSASNASDDPWKSLMSDSPDQQTLMTIANDATMPSRVRLLAARRLSAMGVTLPYALLGVVIELGLEGGLDVLAAYPDGTARYFNYSGRVLIWETNTADSDTLIERLMQASEQIVSQIGPWNKPRRMFPPQDTLRISFLGADALYFGEGGINTMFADPLASPALQAATALMQFLTSQQTKG